jgi:hypothetical protein
MEAVRVDKRMARVTFLVAVASVLCACGSTDRDGLTLHAPEQRTLSTADVTTGESVVCVTHGARISAELPSAESDASNPGQASGSDYASPGGGSLSVDDDGRGNLTLACR